MPQESVLGLTLFLFHVNDNGQSKEFEMYLHVDHSCLCFCITTFV